MIMPVATRLTVTGVVQGVGFRPYIHRLAHEFALAGWIRNESGQVEIHVEGAQDAVELFAAALPRRAPPLSNIECVDRRPTTVLGVTEFSVADSHANADADANALTHARLPVPADVVTCDACAAEIFDATSRRYHYPFTTCTDCGPRYTVIDALPYDRERTSLREFPLCADCLQEYTDPADRRFHAESTACPVCGPQLQFELIDAAGPYAGAHVEPHAGVDANVSDPVQAAAAVIARGGIVALRGLGGFHLAVDATNEAAVDRLRARKHRYAKPLACMVRSVSDVMHWTAPTAAELAWLTSRERPIVLLTRDRHACATSAQQKTHALADALAPGLDALGFMLPSTPLHFLLLDAVGGPLVMTSGNLANEPLAASNEEARVRLAHIADALLTHNRDIVARIDDSVMRVAGDMPVMIRRARGYAPAPVTLPILTPTPVLAVGAHLKNTFTLAADNHAYVSPHIGDLESLESLNHWHAVLARYESLFHITPLAIAADEHDGYLSTHAALELAGHTGYPVLRVQHHHAHIAAVAAEHGVTDRVLGLAFDGTGAGADGTVWGMEFLAADLVDYQRVAHLRPAPLPGGDAAVRAPWRTLAGYWSLQPDAFPWSAVAPADSGATEQRVVQRQIASMINTPLASSAGRLFDAVAALLGVCHVAQYEGEAAMRLESCAGQLPGMQLPFPIVTFADGHCELDPVPLLAALHERHASGVSSAQCAADFHATFAGQSVALAVKLAQAHSLRTIALGGGCFQNARLLTAVRDGLADAGYHVLTARNVPCNDGGVSYGQAAVAAARLSRNAAETDQRYTVASTRTDVLFASTTANGV